MRDMKEGKDPGNAFSELNATKFDMPERKQEGELQIFIDTKTQT